MSDDSRDSWPKASTAGKILGRIRQESRDEYEKGHWFENLFLQLIRDMPDFEVKESYRWEDWPDRERLTRLPLKDSGIDLVAVTNNDKLIAIQCKCYDEATRIQREDINSFLAVSGSPFDMRWIVSTCEWGSNAEEVIGSVEPPVRRIDFHQYDKTSLREGKFERKKREPLELQKYAIKNVVSGLSNKDRGQLIMACGTGKTYTALCIAEQLTGGGGR